MNSFTPPSAQTIDELLAILALVKDAKKAEDVLSQLKKLKDESSEAFSKASLMKDEAEKLMKQNLEKEKELNEMALELKNKVNSVDQQALSLSGRESALKNNEKDFAQEKEAFFTFKKEETVRIRALQDEANRLSLKAADKLAEAQALKKTYEEKVQALKNITG